MNGIAGDAVLRKLCELVAHTSKAETVVLVECSTNGSGRLRGAFGSVATKLSGPSEIPLLGPDAQPTRVERNLKNSSWFAKHPLKGLAPFAKYLVAILVPGSEIETTRYLALFYSGSGPAIGETDLGYLSKVAQLLGELCNSEQSGFGEGQNAFERDDTRLLGEPALLSFLENTLIKSTNLLARDGVAYLGLRKWKSTIKPSQVAALEGLKIVPSQIAASAIARELQLAINTYLHGLRFSAVVPIPGGSSGKERSLSVLIAEQLAVHMGLPCKLVLSGRLSSGRSHPKKSARLPPYLLKEDVSGHVLLVDDVVTTGRHFVLATKVLRESGATVSAIAWIAG